MAVIINELEVVLETPAATPAPAAAATPAPPSSLQIKPLDVIDISEREARAEWRLMAH